MKSLLTLLLILFSLVFKAQTIPMYVGGYTDGEGEGIYLFQFNTVTGDLTDHKLVAKINNPSYIVLSPEKEYLYSVCELDNYKGLTSGAICSFVIKADGTLDKTSERSSNGAHPCHLGIDEDGTRLVVSNYTGGNFSIYNLTLNGDIERAFQITKLDRENRSAKTHSAQFYKEKLFVADLGIDSFEEFEFNNNRYISKKSFPLVKNSGPRHFDITKKGKFIYIINEYGSTVTTFKKEKDAYIRVTDVTTLEKGYEGINSCADIHLSKDDKFLYGSNRGANTIVVYKRDKKDGSLKQIQNISTYGNWPRNFTLDPSGKFLLAANQKSNSIAVFSIDKKTGMLTYLHTKESPSPSCLVF